MTKNMHIYKRNLLKINLQTILKNLAPVLSSICVWVYLYYIHSIVHLNWPYRWKFQVEYRKSLNYCVRYVCTNTHTHMYLYNRKRNEKLHKVIYNLFTCLVPTFTKDFITKIRWNFSDVSFTFVIYWIMHFL